MGARGAGRLWSWAQYARTARRVSFRMLSTGHASLYMSGKPGSMAFIPPEKSVRDRYVPTYSPAGEIKPLPVDRKHCPAYCSVSPFEG